MDNNSTVPFSIYVCHKHRGNIGAPLALQFVPKVKLLRTDFILNHNQVPPPEDDENTAITDIFDSITTAGGFTYFSRNESVSIMIDNCRFINNRANEHNASGIRPVVLSANGHGGAVLMHLAEVKGGTICITNSLFEGNEAQIDGGGIYFSLSSNISSNSVYLYNNTFISNRAMLSSGGGISWNTFSSSFNNSLILEDCDFIGNRGSAGGAMSISLYETNLDSFLLPDGAKFIRCLFRGNVADVEGTAVGLFALVHAEEFGYPVEFSNW